MHQGRLRAFLVRLTHRYDLADDIAQDAFVTAYSKLNQYTGGGSFSGWLFKIAYNGFLEHQRRENRRTEVTNRFSAEFQIVANHYESISNEQLDLERAMSQLREEEVAALSLCYSYGMSHTEAAEVLSIPVGSVKTHINRGKQKLKQLLHASNQSEQAS